MDVLKVATTTTLSLLGAGNMHVDVVNVLLDADADADPNNGRTWERGLQPLHVFVASAKDCMAVVGISALLIHRGAGIGQDCLHKATPAMLAAAFSTEAFLVYCSMRELT